MNILVKCFLLFLFNTSLNADVYKCVANYNLGATERNNAIGASDISHNYYIRAISNEESDKKGLYKKAVEWINIGLKNLDKANDFLDLVKSSKCPEKLLGMAETMTGKNFSDRKSYEARRSEIMLNLNSY